MFIFKDKESLSAYLKNSALGNSLGFVPTMGALHQGHLSLIRQSNAENDLTICSIFVNPKQFNDENDLKHYPRPIENDIRLLTEAGCSVLFLPYKEEMYPEGEQIKHVELGTTEIILEGKFRKGHFQGVSLIVEKLLMLIQPQNLYIGQKDFQQCIIVKKLITLKKIPVNTHIVQTYRAQDGLAMSSRNERLTEAQRASASLIYQCLISIQSKMNMQNFPIVQKECWDILEKKGFKPDYVEIADAITLELLEEFDPNKKMVALIAASIGEVRLIDNLIL